MITYTLQSNIFALLILLFIYQGVKKQINKFNVTDRSFIYILYANAIILIIDSISIFLYDVPGVGIHVIQSILKASFYILNPVPGLLWLVYVYGFIFHQKKIINKFFIIASIPVLINAVLSIMSVWTGYLFTLDAMNHYSRGSLFLLMPGFAFAYALTAFIMIHKYRQRIQTKEMLALLGFSIPPIIGGILQTLVYGLVVLWPALTLSILIIYIFIQSKTSNTDFLTGFNNQREFNNHLEDWKKWYKEDKKIVGFMMDMDRFKEINDTYGHQIGDKALIEISTIIRESFGRNDFIARLGGDEFAVIKKVNECHEIDQVIDKLTQKIDMFNKHNKDSYQLSISYGYQAFDMSKYDDMTMFFNEVDKIMYKEKELKNKA